MRSARHQLILLGFVCQGMSWDGWLLPALYVGLWILCLAGPRRSIRVGPLGEGVALLLGCGVGYLVGAALGRSTHFFLGHGLVAVQAVRLLRPLSRRERVMSFLIACFHLGVACTFVFDLRFLGIMAGVVVLLPRALRELALEGYGGLGGATGAGGGMGWVLGGVGVVAVVFFLGFPRWSSGPPLPMRVFGGVGEGSLRETVIDAARSGLAQSSRVLMQVEGEGVGYMRCFSLVDTDGVRWLAAERAPLKRYDYRSREQLGAFVYRRVRVKNAGFLERLIPTDGQVVQVEGNFFSRPFQNGHGGAEAVAMWNTANNVYEYWVRPRGEVEALYGNQRERYTRAPEVSARVRTWMEEVVAGASEAYGRARRLEAHLRERFGYRLGAPELNRLSALEDFLFEQREGHCERFASVLALLLRAQGIPSRVVIGYLPQARNVLTGATVIRFKDAHAWVEGWFEGRGWVTLDATPPVREAGASWSLRGLWEDLDLAWSSYVVNLDGAAQRQMWMSSWEGLRGVPGWLVRQASVVGVGVGLVLLGAGVWRGRRWRWGWLGGRSPGYGKAQAVVGSLYGRMLEAVGRAGYRRRPQDTPLEFAGAVRQGGYEWSGEVEEITRGFCVARYGGRVLGESEWRGMEGALARIKAGGAGLGCGGDRGSKEGGLAGGE